MSVVIAVFILCPSNVPDLMGILFTVKQESLISFFLLFLREYEDLWMDSGVIKGLAVAYHQIKGILREAVSKLKYLNVH